MNGVYDFYAGKKVDEQILPWIYENLMLTGTSMSLDEIRDMAAFDFENHVLILIARENAKHDNPNKKKPAPKAKDILNKKAGRTSKGTKSKFDPEINDFREV